MKILAWPALKNKKDNPYNWLLYSNIKKLKNIEIEEFNISRALLRRYNLIHMHWPEYFLNKKNNLEVSFKLIAFCTLISLLKLKGTKIIWTAHNSSSHEKNHLLLESLFWKYFIKNLDGYITLTQSGKEELIERYPLIKRIKQFTIPHGDYRDEYKDTISKEKARRLLKIKNDELMILNFGKVRGYKGILSLIREFRKINIKNALLYIVGNCQDLRLANEIQNNADCNIRFVNNFITSDKVQIYFKSADLIILPYIEISNSGALFLALSFNKPVLVPETPTFKEIQKQIGEKWIKTYKGQINSKIIKDNLIWINRERKGKVNLEKFNWDNISRQTKQAYLEVISNNE
ncbi:MAG: glycosyltransferase [Nanoarchaeota archaeon]|nr:glycosyltransferase [Nanoarchaeota archaeon]